MSTLPPSRKSSLAEASEPQKKSGAVLQAGIAALIIAAIAVYYLWSRVSSLESQLTSVEQRAEQLDSRLEQARQEAESLRRASESAQATAQGAQQEVEQETSARQRAELAREFARDRAERAKLETERAQADAARSREEAENLRKAREKELDRMQEALSHIAETSRTPLGLVVSLGEDRFLFDFDKADLKPENRELLSRISGVLLASHGYRLYVYGHTDDVGTQEYNQGLSERRAKSVREYLVKAGLPGDIIEMKGFGKSSPRVASKTDAARRKNRRVEIGVVDTIVNYEGRIPDASP